MGRLGLVIDDDSPSRLMYTSMLKGMGFQTYEAADGIAAMELLQSQKPDVIFLDLLLPKKNGLELIAYIYDAPHLAQVHVIVITAHNHYKQELQLRDGDYYFLKPISLNEIRAAIEECL